MKQFGADIVLIFLPAVVLRAHPPAGIVLLFGRHGIPAVLLGVHHTLARCPVTPFVHGGIAALERPPLLSGTVDDAPSADFDVRLAVCAQRRLALLIASVARFLADSEQFAERLIEAQPRVELDDGHVVQMKSDVALEDNRSGEPHAVGNHERAATLAGQMVHCPGKGVGAQCQPVALGSEVSQRHGIVGYLRVFNAHGERSGAVCLHVAGPTVGGSQCHCRHDECGTDCSSHVLIRFE